MWSFDQEHMAQLPLLPPIASCSPFVRGKGEGKEKTLEYRTAVERKQLIQRGEWDRGRTRQRETNKERKWRKRRKMGRAVIKEGGSPSSRAAGLQAPC